MEVAAKQLPNACQRSVEFAEFPRLRKARVDARARIVARIKPATPPALVEPRLRRCIFALAAFTASATAGGPEKVMMRSTLSLGVAVELEAAVVEAFTRNSTCAIARSYMGHVCPPRSAESTPCVWLKTPERGHCPVCSMRTRCE